MYHSTLPTLWIPVQVIWQQLAGSKHIITFWPMLLIRDGCTGNSITLGRNIMTYAYVRTVLITLGWNLIYHSILTYAFRQTYLYMWFDHTNRNLMYQTISTNALRQKYLYKWFLHTWATILGSHTCTSDLITLGGNLIYHSILTYALRHTYLYKWFEHTWQVLNVSFHSDHRQIYLDKWFDHTWQELYCIIPLWPTLLRKIHVQVIWLSFKGT
jgi:hypothetical protein